MFRATLAGRDGLNAVAAGQLCWAELELRNESPGETRQYEELRTDLPRTLRPGETTRLVAQVLPPAAPGRYVLQWDLVIEHVTRFSAQGWWGPAITVRVEG